MAQETITLAGLTVSLKDIPPWSGYRRQIPPDWHCVSFEAEAMFFGSVVKEIKRYLREEGFAGAFEVISATVSTRRIYVFFEMVEDAVMFRLKGGETAWINSSTG